MTSASLNPRRRFFPFSLRGLLLLVTVVGVGLGWAIHEAKKQGIAVAALAEMGCKVTYASNTPLTMIERLRKMLGDDEATSVRVVNAFNSEIRDGDLVYLQEIRRLEWLNLGITNVTDAGLEQVGRLTDLEFLNLYGTQVTDAGLVHLGGLTHLQYLFLEGTSVTDAGLAHLRGLKHLKWLQLRNTQVTDTGVQELQKALPNCRIEH